MDENLSPHLAAGLYAFGEDVIHLRDKFPGATNDCEWLEFVGKSGRFLITRDQKIRWRPAEIAALKEHRIGAFFIAGKQLDRCTLVRQVVRCWPELKTIAVKKKRPFMYAVRPGGGKVEPLGF